MRYVRPSESPVASNPLPSFPLPRFLYPSSLSPLLRFSPSDSVFSSSPSSSPSSSLAHCHPLSTPADPLRRLLFASSFLVAHRVTLRYATTRVSRPRQPNVLRDHRLSLYRWIVSSPLQASANVRLLEKQDRGEPWTGLPAPRSSAGVLNVPVTDAHPSTLARPSFPSLSARLALLSSRKRSSPIPPSKIYPLRAESPYSVPSYQRSPKLQFQQTARCYPESFGELAAAGSSRIEESSSHASRRRTGTPRRTSFRLYLGRLANYRSRYARLARGPRRYDSWCTRTR